MATSVEYESIERGFQRLSSIFRPPVLDSYKCHRCKNTVYHAEKIGPVHEVIYHRLCFRCIVCNQHLTMKNYSTNQVDPNDHDIYCSNHFPRVGAAKIDQGAIGICGAVLAQENFERMAKKLDGQVRKPGTVRIPTYNAEAIAIKRILTSSKAQEYAAAANAHSHISLPPDAMGIKHPLAAQKMQTANQYKYSEHRYQPKYKKKLIESQIELEKKHRKEEEDLLKIFQLEREREKQKLAEEISREWEVKLKELTNMFEKDLSKKNKKLDDRDTKLMTVHFETQKKELEKSLTLKRNKIKEFMTLRLRENEQSMTSTLITTQSEQMLDMLAKRKDELRKDLEKELSSQPNAMEDPTENEEVVKEIIETMQVLGQTKKTEVPPPHPPVCRKNEIYSDLNIFAALDEKVFKIAERNQMTYTELVQQLTDGLLTDLEKVRAIFRWITVKDLNVMDFDDSLDDDTPLGLLRGIKYGTETYHMLFMRLCSYAGLHCVEIKGHSKSAGYEPGMKLQPEMFQNTWNAVLIDCDWRLVQCNWGARHLVLNQNRRQGSGRNVEHDVKTKTEQADNEKCKVNDKMRYQYDEHYFLTDPDELIQEFWPRESEWQLLEVPITLDEFEALPFVRSVFFHFGMKFERSIPAVIETNDRGYASVRIRFAEKYENDLVFYYQLRFADTQRKLADTYRGTNLERYVFQTTMDNIAIFSIHVPTIGEYYLEVFANKIDETNKIGGTEDAISPLQLQCACKFKIRCKTLTGKIHPLPDCAAGEWGPNKAIRHFGMQPIFPDHSDSTLDGESSSSNDSPENPKVGIFNVEDSINLMFKLPLPLQFAVQLKMNDVEENVLDPFVYHTIESDILTVTVQAPQVGQYGIDIYAKPCNSDTKILSHACKYLLNAIKAAHPVEFPQINRTFIHHATIGPSPSFQEIGIKLLSHPNAQITVDENDNKIRIVIKVPEYVEISFQMIREPDEDCKEFVTMSRDDKNKKNVFFTINFGKHGNYLFCIYARRTKGYHSMSNVFNYLILHKKKSPIISVHSNRTKAHQLQSVDEKKRPGNQKRANFGSTTI